MSVLRVEVGEDSTTFRTDDATTHDLFVVPIGHVSLTRSIISSDPPRPEELTNAIGVVLDHLDDLLRERPEVAGMHATVAGDAATDIAAVEVGHVPILPFTLSRDAMEDVFRTVATESRADRARNPGLREQMVTTIVAGCCIAVALMRRLQLDEIEIVP